MSDLVQRLGVSLSTVSGLVDRIVDHGLATRREDPADRRQVVVGADAAGHGLHRPLPRAQRRARCARCSRPLDDDELASVRRRARPPSPAPPTGRRAAAAAARATPKGPRMSRLSELAVAKRSVTLLLAGALFIAGILAWGNLKQELLPDIEFPVITVIAPLPGRRRGRRRRPGDQADRARDLGRAPPRGPPVDVRQLAGARRRPVLVRHRRQGDARGDRAEPPGRGPPGVRRARPSPRSTSTPRP